MTKALTYALALGAMLLATPAVAATVTANTDPISNPNLLAAPTNSSGFHLNLTTSVSGDYRSPFDTLAPPELDDYYNSVDGGGFARYVFGANQTQLSLIWGSPDDYNFLDFYDDGALVTTIVGNDAAILAALSLAGFAVQTHWANVVVSGLIFDEVIFRSTTNAFEHVFNFRSDAIPEVPLPAGLLLLFSGLAGLGFLGRSRAKAA